MPGPVPGGPWLLLTVIDRLRELNLFVLVVKGRLETALGWKRWIKEVWEAQGALWKNKWNAQPPTALVMST